MLDAVKHSAIWKGIESEVSSIQGFAINSVEMVNNPAQTRLFHGCIEKIEKREKLKEFQPNLDIESNPEARKKTLESVRNILVFW